MFLLIWSCLGSTVKEVNRALTLSDSLSSCYFIYTTYLHTISQTHTALLLYLYWLHNHK